jgi:hypothetical protein
MQPRQRRETAVRVADYGSYSEFLSCFVAPLIEGGRVEVRDVVGPGVLKAWVRPTDVNPNLVARVTESMRKNLCRIGPAASASVIPLDAMALALVWHNLLAISHPDARKRTALRRKVRLWADDLLEWAGAPITAGDVALRHAVLGGIVHLGRVDTHVTFWAGYADFVGVSPPATLVAWPKARRVREDKTRLTLNELLAPLDEDISDAKAELFDVVRVAFALSPLTDFSLPDRPPGLGFSWTSPTVNAVADEAIRGAVQRILLARGTAAIRVVERSTLTLCEDPTVEGDVLRLLVRFHLELLLTAALSDTSKDARLGVSQPLANDVFVVLGHKRVAEITGISVDMVQRAITLSSNRSQSKEPPSRPLLERAGVLEKST